MAARTTWFPLRAFISYVQTDSQALAISLRHGLCTDYGWTDVWLDALAVDRSTGGMKQGVAEHEHFIAIISDNYFERQYCRMEFAEAVRLHRHIIAVYPIAWIEPGRLSRFIAERVPAPWQALMSEISAIYAHTNAEFLNVALKQVHERAVNWDPASYPSATALAAADVSASIAVIPPSATTTPTVVAPVALPATTSGFRPNTSADRLARELKAELGLEGPEITEAVPKLLVYGLSSVQKLNGYTAEKLVNRLFLTQSTAGIIAERVALLARSNDGSQKNTV